MYDVGRILQVGGNGANNVAATDLEVEKNLTILNGTNTAGSDLNNLVNLTVSRSVTINNGAGNTSTTIQRNSAGLSSIGGSVLITNGFDQGLRFSVDKATYELLYLPIAPGKRVSIKNAIDMGEPAGHLAVHVVEPGIAALGDEGQHDR